MKQRTYQLAAATLTFTSAFETFAQTAASSPLPPPSGASHQTNPGAPGGGFTWFVAGMALGLVVGYMVGKNAKKEAAASPPSQ